MYIHRSLVQVQLGEPKSLENQGFFYRLKFYDIRNGVENRNSRW